MNFQMKSVITCHKECFENKSTEKEEKGGKQLSFSLPAHISSGQTAQDS